MRNRGVRNLSLAGLAAIGLAVSGLAAHPSAVEAATLRRVLWSETFSRYDYRRQNDLRARCTASATTPGIDYTEARITPGPAPHSPSTFECIGVSIVTITNPPTPVVPTDPPHQIAPPRWTP